MTTTDKQLKQALAKMLPDQIIHYDTYYSPKHDAHLKDGLFWIGGDEILDTEWLHVCWLVEQVLTPNEQEHYKDELDEWTENYEWVFIHATWQQRAIALRKVKAIEL